MQAENKYFIVIQGHTRECDFLINHYKNVENVIWATDENAPKENLKKIEESSITLVTIPEIYAGYGNINFQTRTTVKGLEKAKESGATHVIKIRSDMYFTDEKKFFELIKTNGKIQQMCYINMIDPTPHQNRGGRVNDIQNWIKSKGFEVINNQTDCLLSYVPDFCNYGEIDEMLLYWDYPFEETELKVSAEYKLLFNYFQKKEYEYDFSFENFSDKFGFFLKKINENGIQLMSLKHNYDFSTLVVGSWKWKEGYLA